MIFPEGLRLNPLSWGEAEVSPQGWVKSSGMCVKRWCLWLSSAGHSILPQQYVVAAANPAGHGELTLAAVWRSDVYRRMTHLYKGFLPHLWLRWESVS